MTGCGEYVRGVNAKIVGCEPGEEYDIEMGHVKAQVIQLQRIVNDNIDLWWVSSIPTAANPAVTRNLTHRELLDGYSEDLSYVYAALLSPEAKTKHKAEERLQDELDGDLLYVDEVRLKSKYRGYGIGLMAVRGLIESLPSFATDAVVICPAALPDEDCHAIVDGEDLGHVGGYCVDGVHIRRPVDRREASRKLARH